MPDNPPPLQWLASRCAYGGAVEHRTVSTQIPQTRCKIDDASPLPSRPPQR